MWKSSGKEEAGERRAGSGGLERSWEPEGSGAQEGSWERVRAHFFWDSWTGCPALNAGHFRRTA